MSYSIYPNSTIIQWRGLKGNERGLWYSPGLNNLLIGKLDEDGFLVGKVIHNGLTQEMCDKGQYYLSGAFREGYTYDHWDLHEFEFLGGWDTFFTLKGYLDFLGPATYDQIKAYFKAKPLVLDIERRKKDSKARLAARNKVKK